MDIGIGVPNSTPDTTGAQLIDWSRRADEAGFSTLASIGAVSYPSYEELTVFAAAGAVTEHIRFMTNVMIAPARSSAELAKQAATVDQLTNGRLTLGLGVGWRATDYELTGRSFDNRGALFDMQLADLQKAWAGEALSDDTRPVAPPTVRNGGVPLLIGGTTDAAIRRVVEHGVGWTAGGMPPDAVEQFANRVRAAWADAGREGTPRITALAYFALGDTTEESRHALLDYYGPMGAETAEMIAGSALRSPDAISGAIGAFTAAGVDEFILNPTVADGGQVDMLADVVF